MLASIFSACSEKSYILLVIKDSTSFTETDFDQPAGVSVGLLRTDTASCKWSLKVLVSEINISAAELNTELVVTLRNSFAALARTLMKGESSAQPYKETFYTPAWQCFAGVYCPSKQISQLIPRYCLHTSEELHTSPWLGYLLLVAQPRQWAAISRLLVCLHPTWH